MADTQNTPVVIGDTLPTSIKSAHVRKLAQFSKVTGQPVSKILDRAIDNFMNVEAPVYRAYAKRGQQV